MRKIGKYEVVEELGRGGMGVVYRAYDPSLERDVALKVIRETALDDADTKARFYREARMAARLTHDAIAVIYEIGEEKGLPFIAMEYLPGRELKEVIDKKEVLSLEHKLEYARQICRGLQYAHAKNVIHRDIKPENVRLLDDGRLKIIDFGIAKPYIPTASEKDKSTDVVLTRIGMRVGTPWYMSPEQARGNPVDNRTDIFSFGVVLYELLTYSKPFQGDDTTVLYKILHEEPPPIKLEESGLTDEVQRILSRCLAKELDDRYADCSDILRDLIALTSGPSQDPRIRTLLTEGIALDQAEQYKEAMAKFNQILEIDPNNQQAKSFLKRLSLRDRETFMRRILAGDIIGTIISHFQILDRIGGGGMGVVYRAEDMSLKRIVALKFLMPDLVRDPSAKKRFLKEAQAASALDHPNICTVHEIGETPEGLLFICMAYYGGENLSARINREPLSVGEALDIVIRIGRGLAKAHEHGIVHRDIKPANIIITPDAEIKIVDFGLAKLSGGTQITRVGARMGTLPFMSPEQIRGLDLDHRTDIWSLGVLLFKALTGQLPFQREYEAAMLYAITTDDPPLLTTVNPGLPVDLEKVISKALKKDPNERYASVQTMVDELERIKTKVVQTRELGIAHGQEAESLLREAKDLMVHGRYRESLVRVQKILKVAPTHARALELRDECMKRIEQADQVTMLLREGTALFDKGKFKEARDVLQGVLEVQPAQPDATRIVEEANGVLERQEQIEKLTADAEISLKHDKVDAAAAAYRSILSLDPGNKNALRGLKKVKSGQASGARHITPPPGARPPSARKFLWITLAVVALCGVVFTVLVVLPKHTTAPATTTEEPKADLAAPATAARNDMLSRKTTAEQAGAPTLDKSSYEAARRIEAQGEDAFSSGSYDTAKQSFEKAAALYRKSAEDAATVAAASKDLSGLQTLVSSAREEMLVEKTAARKTGGKALTSSQYTDALKLEAEGDKGRSSQDREVLQSSRNAYLLARDGFRKVNEEAARVAGLRRDADNQIAAMNSSKQEVPGSDQEKRANAKYRSAMEAENGARGLYQLQDYAPARDGFARAQSLYTQAAGEISAALAESKPGQPPADAKTAEKNDPAKIEREERETGVRQTLETFKKSYEEGDVQTAASLRSNSEEAAKGYESFFKVTDKRSLTIGQVTFQPDMTHARAELVQKFVNRDQGGDPQSLGMVATLEFVNGRWTITSFSRK